MDILHSTEDIQVGEPDFLYCRVNNVWYHEDTDFYPEQWVESGSNVTHAKFFKDFNYTLSELPPELLSEVILYQLTKS